jgi:hypothetical protein
MDFNFEFEDEIFQSNGRPALKSVLTIDYKAKIVTPHVRFLF